MKLEKAVNFRNGKKRPNTFGNIPIYGGNGILGFTNKFNAKSENIIIGRVGAYCGCVYKNDDACWVSDNAIVGNVNNGYDYNYMYYKLKSLNLNKLHIGSSHPLMTQNILNNIEINIPKLEIQIKIGNILNLLDAKIELNNKINDNLHKLVNYIYNNMFKNKTDYLDRLGNYVQCILGGTPNRDKKEYWNGNINWINSGEVNNFRIIKPSEKITELGLKKSSATLMPRGTTVVAITGATLGQVSRLEIDSCANQSVVGIIGNKNLTNNYIYLCILNNIEDITKNQTGGAQQHINKGNVEDFMIYIPSKKELDEFENKVSDTFDKIALNCKENQVLEQLRDTLLPKLMNGEIDLENIEI